MVLCISQTEDRRYTQLSPKLVYIVKASFFIYTNHLVTMRNRASMPQVCAANEIFLSDMHHQLSRQPENPPNPTQWCSSLRKNYEYTPLLRKCVYILRLDPICYTQEPFSDRNTVSKQKTGVSSGISLSLIHPSPNIISICTESPLQAEEFRP